MIKPTRRDLLKMLLASVVAATVDVEQLLWVKKPIITVPQSSTWPVAWEWMPYIQLPNVHASVGRWLAYSKEDLSLPMFHFPVVLTEFQRASYQGHDLGEVFKHEAQINAQHTLDSWPRPWPRTLDHSHDHHGEWDYDVDSGDDYA